jgi:DNA-binding NarL/FixJ family response regulator
MPVRVLLVEDNEVYRTTLELLLGSREGIEVVGSVADGGDAAAEAARLAPDVVLMDFRLPGLDGARATAAVLEAAPETAVICLTAEATDDDRSSVLAAGAAALIEKGASTDDLVAAVHDALTSRERSS